MATRDSVIGDIIDGLKKVILELLGAIGRFFGSLFNAEVKVEENIRSIVADFETLKSNLTGQVQQLRDFKFDPHWSSRVIHVPTAITAIKDLIDQIFNGDHGVLAKFETLKDPIHEFSLIFKSESEESGLPQDQPSKFAKAAVKIDEIATLIAQLAHAMQTVKEFDALFQRIIDDIEHLDDLFLPQDSPRTTGDYHYAKRNA